MTSPKQIEANRRNSLKSTGPKTDHGKRRSRGNALKHGLAAETVVEAFEERKDYKKFQAVIVSDYAPQSCVEHELVLRVASLLWRLRRATLIETGLLEIQGQSMSDGPHENDGELSPKFPQILGLPNGFSQQQNAFCGGSPFRSSPLDNEDMSRPIAQTFLRLSDLGNSAFERVGYYETRLWRQLAQTLVALRMMRRSLPLKRSGLFRNPDYERNHSSESRIRHNF